uniref:Uncharacterized protein n=1 Tax=Lactuca sativa TaxID=4236 RepID=A0A9R1WYU8_LACSA|nr:hypothetical protein LSAT_V11C800392350 [Lactuca sativa]
MLGVNPSSERSIRDPWSNYAWRTLNQLRGGLFWLLGFEEAEKAIVVMDGSEMLIQNVNIDWAFSEGPFRRRNNRRRSPHGNWSRSPRMRFGFGGVDVHKSTH